MEESEFSETTETNALLELTDCKSTVTNLEAQVLFILHEKKKLEEDFGLQRARLKDIYIQKEEVVKLQVEKNLTLKAENEQKSILLLQLQGELDELRSQVTVEKWRAENEVDVERRKFMEEIASLTRIQKDEMVVNKSEIDQLRKEMNVLKAEKFHYRSLCEKKNEVNPKANCTSYDSAISECTRSNPNSMVSLKLQHDSLPQLTDDQKRVLSGGVNCTSEQLLNNSQTSTPIILTENEWLSLQKEITNYQKLLSVDCKKCTELESTLKLVESELKDVAKRKETAEKAIGRIKEELQRESDYRKKSEIKWRQMVEDFERNEKNLELKVEQAITRHKEMISASKEGFQMVYEKSNDLMKKRDLVNKELARLQNENDSLVGKHSIHSRELQNEIINLPDTMEDMQLLLLKYREDIIAAKVAKEHIEETLQAKIIFIKDQLEGEQHEKGELEMRLSLEIEQFRDKAGMSASLEEKLQNERQSLLQTEEKLKKAEQKGCDSITRSQHFITGLKNQVEEHEQEKAQTESVIIDLKSRLSSLQQDLKTSEAVQRDFVRLSQSLQVHLEKIRQSEKEVRWQHEDDIEDCNRCNQKFNAVGRRKHHCKHCGKIFCSECVVKTVASGPNRRLSKVCDVCHTLLVRDATPFFSTEPPHSPD